MNATIKQHILHILCEGQTEQEFVEKVLKQYLLEKGVDAVKTVLLSTNRKLNARGGLISYQQAINDLNLMKMTSCDGACEKHIFTTMFDLYALPNDFPKYKDSLKICDKYARTDFLEQSFARDLNEDERFIPYIQLHEFESLVFCGLQYLTDIYPNCERGVQGLKMALLKQPNPELINNGAETAPSKRLIKAIERDSKIKYNYNKPKTGRYVTQNVGIDELRSKCKHFDQWVIKLLEKLRLDESNS